MQHDTSLSHRVDQAVDWGLWTVRTTIEEEWEKFLDIGRNWNMLSYTSIPNMPNR
jgi:hypothetical protein